MDVYAMAIHEAGHAVASVLWGRQVQYVTIAPCGEILSECNNGELFFSLEDSQEVNVNILVGRYRSSGAVNTACPDARYR